MIEAVINITDDSNNKNRYEFTLAPRNAGKVAHAKAVFNTIQAECVQRDSCLECPYYSLKNKACHFTIIPSRWNVDNIFARAERMQNEDNI